MKIITVIALTIAISACAGATRRGEAIRERISEAPDLATHNISIDEERHGDITLNGSVSSEEDRNTIEKIARNTSGVRDVHSNLIVQASSVAVRDGYSDTTSTDRAILSDIRSNMSSSSQLRDYIINVEVLESVVTLRGEVGSERERSIAENIARNTRGVLSVRNELTLDNHRYNHSYKQR